MRRGGGVWSNALGSEPSVLGLREFKSHPLHFQKSKAETAPCPDIFETYTKGIKRIHALSL